MLYGWKENSMLTNCFAACAHLSITVSEILCNLQQLILFVKISSFYHAPLHLTPPLGGFPSEYRHPFWDGKTRMVSLPDGEKISKVCLFVLTWSTNVTDRQTDRRTLCDSKDSACIASRGKNCVWGIVLLKLTTDRHEASRGLCDSRATCLR